MAIEKTFCTTREAAARLGISIGTVQLWVEKGLLSAWKTEGGHRRVTRESIDKLLNVHPGPTLVAAPEVSTGRLQILVVEDSSNLRRLYEIVMSQWPMAPQLTLVDSAIKAIMLLEREHTDLLVLDLGMPGIDGFELVRILKSDKKHANLSIAAVTGIEPTDISKRGGLPRDVMVFGKPVPFSKLLDLANEINDRKKQGK